MVDTKEWLEQQLILIDQWEKEQSDLWFWKKLGRIPFKLLDKDACLYTRKNRECIG